MCLIHLYKSHSRLDTKQSPYRILFRRAGSASFLQVAVAETEKKAEVAWSWLECMYLLIVYQRCANMYVASQFITFA